jgi:hypothetical protein
MRHEPILPPPHCPQQVAFFAQVAVRARIFEFLGARGRQGPSARFVSTLTGADVRPFSPAPAGRLWAALAADGELARSLLDGDGLIADIDLEHVHFDRPWESYLDPSRAFALQEPVAAALEARLDEVAIDRLRVLTGRGHHWLWRIDRGSPVFAALAALAPAEVAAGHRRPLPAKFRQREVDAQTAAAYHGLGLVLEWLGHQTLRAVEGETEVPVQLTAIRGGPGPHGREAVSFDISAFGDPLSVRTTRVPFTFYRKAERLGGALDPPLDLAPLVAVPWPAGLPIAEALALRHPAAAACLAANCRVAIPDGSPGMAALLEGYRTSPLAAFHRWYYACDPEPPERWGQTYDRLDLSSLPPCAARILEQPNDRLLRPAEIQQVVRVLLAFDWHPRHIAGLVRARLESDQGWIPGIHFVDPAVRADFYVRLFAGMVLARTDRLIDFNCVSASEKPICPGTGCPFNLAQLRTVLTSQETPWATGR